MRTFSTLYHIPTKYILNHKKVEVMAILRKLLSVATPMEGWAVEHNFEREPSMDSSIQV
jgi:hypothetical protein